MTSPQVVVGYDGSPSSQVALDWALREARARDLSLQIVHAGYVPTATIAGFVTLMDPNPDQLLEIGSQLLADAAEHARHQAPEVAVSTTLVPGPATPVLLDAFSHAELGVVGARGLGTFDALLLGSTSLHLATHAQCPVVVVRGDEQRVQNGRVVVGVDGSADAAAALGFAFEEASFRGCGLIAVCAWQEAQVDSEGWLTDAVVASVSDDDAARALSESLSGWVEQYPDVDVAKTVVRGEPVPVLVDASTAAELLVVGSRGLGGFRSLLLGSVGHGVLHHAHSPVAIIKATTR